MSKIAYVPFADSGLASYVVITTTTFNDGRIFDRFKQPVVQYSASLASVKKGDQLYLFAHGAPRGSDVEDNVGNKLTMPELAKRWKDSGLRLDIEKVKLNACNGGIGGGESTTFKLIQALNSAGYANVKVYGYLDSLMVESQGGSKVGEQGARAKDIRVGFQKVGTGAYKNL